MNKIIRLIYIYLLIGLPFVVACMVWGNLRSENEALTNATFFTKVSWEILSWNLMLWFAILIIFLLILVVAPSARENTLRHLANLKERDEREEYITGRAARAAYISTLSLIIFFLFFSLFSLSVYRLPSDHSIPKKHITVNIHLGVSLFDTPKPKNITEGKLLFTTKNLVLSSSSILIILLVWQLSIFNYTARKEQKNGLD